MMKETLVDEFDLNRQERITRGSPQAIIDIVGIFRPFHKVVAESVLPASEQQRILNDFYGQVLPITAKRNSTNVSFWIDSYPRIRIPETRDALSGILREGRDQLRREGAVQNLIVIDQAFAAALKACDELIRAENPLVSRLNVTAPVRRAFRRLGVVMLSDAERYRAEDFLAAGIGKKGLRGCLKRGCARLKTVIHRGLQQLWGSTCGTAARAGSMTAPDSSTQAI